VTVAALVVNGALVLALPGWLLLSALGWPASRPERLLAAGPASLAVVAVFAALLGIIDRGVSTGDVVVLDLALAGVAWSRRGASGTDERLPWSRLALGAAPGLILLGLVVGAMGGLVAPTSQDSLVHAQLIRWFLDGQPAPPYLMDHLAAVRTPETRFGWHVSAALLVRGTGLDPARAVTLATWPVIAMLPGSLMLLVRRAGLSWRTAWLAGFAAIGIGIVPFRVLALGQSPLLAGGYALAPIAAVAVVDAVRLRAVGPCVAAALLTAGLVYVHPSDLPTLALLVAVMSPVALRGARRPTASDLWRWGATVALVSALALPWTRYRAQPLGGPVLGGAQTSALQAEDFLAPRHLDGFLSAAGGALTTAVHDLTLPILAVVAIALAWRRPATRIFTALGVALLVLQLDAWGWQLPQHALTAVFPWSSPERLLYLDWYVLAPLAAIGIEVVASRVASLMRRPVNTALVAAAICGLAVLPAASLAPRVITDTQRNGLWLTDANRQAIASLDGVVPAGDLVLTDGTSDTGAWIPVLTHRDTLLHKDWDLNSAAASVRVALQSLCSPGSAARLRSLQVSWVFLGSGSGGWADHSCVGGTGDLEPVVLPDGGTGGAWLLRVRGSA
jgi:hypothetical protein